MKQLTTLLIFLLFCLSTGAKTRIINLGKKQLSYAPTEYYIAAIKDDRADTTNFGYMHAGMGRRLMGVNLEGGLAVGLHRYINNSVTQNKDNTPVELHLVKLNIKERTRAGGERVDIRAEIDVYRSGEKIYQYTYDAFTQTGFDASYYIGSLLVQMTENFIEAFDKWMKENNNK